MRVAFARLLPHSLSYAKKLPELTTVIGSLLTHHPTISKGLPQVTMEAITDYLGRLHSTSKTPKPRTAASLSLASQRHLDSVQKSSPKATIRKSSTTQTSSTTRPTAQKSSPPPQLPTRPVQRTFLVPSHSARTQPSPSTSRDASNGSRVPRKAPTAPRAHPSTGLSISTLSRLRPTPYTPQYSTQTQPSLNAAQQFVTGSRTPEDASQSPTVPDPTTQFSSTATLETSYAQAQAPSKGPLRHRKRKKAPRK